MKKLSLLIALATLIASAQYLTAQQDIMVINNTDKPVIVEALYPSDAQLHQQKPPFAEPTQSYTSARETIAPNEFYTFAWTNKNGKEIARINVDLQWKDHKWESKKTFESDELKSKNSIIINADGDIIARQLLR